jgi:hypothetical protein
MRTAAPFLLSALAGFAIARLAFAPANPVANVSASRRLRAETPAPQPPEPVPSSRTLLDAALGGNDPLASAARTLAWLETATIADFQSLANDLPNFPVPMFSGFDPLANAMQKDRATALVLLGELDAPDFARCAPSLVDAWAKNEPVAALSWALEHGVPLTTRSWLRSSVVPSFLGFHSTSEHDQVTPIVSAMEANADATLAWIRSLPAGLDRNRLFLLAIPLSKVPLSDSIALLPELPPEWASRAAFSLAFRFAEDPDAGRAWAESLPAGPARSAAWRGLGTTSFASFDLPPGSDRDALLFGRAFGYGVQSDPATSFGVAMQITDPTLRRDAFDLGMQGYLKGDRTNWAGEARAWLEKAGIPEEWKQRWR